MALTGKHVLLSLYTILSRRRSHSSMIFVQNYCMTAKTKSVTSPKTKWYNLQSSQLRTSWRRQAVHTSCVVMLKPRERNDQPGLIKTTMDAQDEISNVSTPPGTVLKKQSLKHRAIAEVLHYYHGFRLLFFDVRVAAKLLMYLARGNKLTRRERRQLVRTSADLFRMIPFLVIVVVPFMEFLLPFFLKVFPNMLPSTFIHEDKKQEKMRKQFKMKIEMAKFLQDTLEDMAKQHKGDKAKEVKEFTEFMAKMRKSGELVSNAEIIKFSKLFENDITLESMTIRQLRALCQMLDLPVIELSPNILRHQLKLRLRHLEADDRLITSEGIDNMSIWELQDACRERGMRTFGMPKQRLKEQLQMWLELHLEKEIPTSLLLLTRSLYMNETVSSPEQVKEQVKEAIIRLQPSAAETAKTKITEESQARPDNKAKLEELQQEEEKILAEKKEQIVKERHEIMSQVNRDSKNKGVNSFLEFLQPRRSHKRKHADMTVIDLVKPTGVSETDLDEVDMLLDQLVQAQADKRLEQEALKNLKDSVEEYLTTVGEVRDSASDESEKKSEVLKDSKAAKILGQKVGTVIHKVDCVIESLEKKKRSLNNELAEYEEDLQDKNVQEEVDLFDNIQLIVDEKRNDLQTVEEALESMYKIKNVIHDRVKAEEVMRILDNDLEGKIDLNEAIMVIDLLSSHNHKLANRQIQILADVLHKEALAQGCEQMNRLRQRQFELQERKRKLAETQLLLLQFLSATGEKEACLRKDEKDVRHLVEDEINQPAVQYPSERRIYVDEIPVASLKQTHLTYDTIWEYNKYFYSPHIVTSLAFESLAEDLAPQVWFWGKKRAERQENLFKQLFKMKKFNQK